MSLIDPRAGICPGVPSSLPPAVGLVASLYIPRSHGVVWFHDRLSGALAEACPGGHDEGRGRCPARKKKYKGNDALSGASLRVGVPAVDRDPSSFKFLKAFASQPVLKAPSPPTGDLG